MEPSEEVLTPLYYPTFFSKFVCTISENIFLSIKTPIFQLSDFENYCNSKNIIHKMAPLLADHIKRCIPFDKLRDVFFIYDSKYKDSLLKYDKISSRNLIEFFLQINSRENRSITGSYLAKMQTSIPLTYWKYDSPQKELRYNIDLSVLYNIIPEISTKVVILNFGLDSSIGKTSLLAKLFKEVNEEAINNNEGNGIAREGTVDLYLTKMFAIIDVNNFVNKFKKFKNFFLELLNVAHAFVFQFSAERQIKKIKKTLKKLKKMGFRDHFEETFFILKDVQGKPQKEIDKWIKKRHINFPKTEIVPLKNLKLLNKNLIRGETIVLKETFDKWLKGLLNSPKKPSLTLEKLMKLNQDEEDKENFLTIENFFMKKSKSSLNPFEYLLPFASAAYKEFKSLENIEATIKDFKKTSIKLENMMSYRFVKYAILDKFFVIRKFDDKIREVTKDFLGDLKSEIAVLNSEYKKTQNKKLKLKLNEKIECLTNNSICYHDLYAELFSFYDYKKNEKLDDFSPEEEKFFDEFKLFLSQSLKNGAKLHLFRGIPLRIRNEFLKEIFGLPILNQGISYYVISILGMQSSGKSTLLNYLFGCDFETSAGRCTRGIYSNIIQTPKSKTKILLLDTEGLASMESNDKCFDHKIALMCLGLSDLVLINQNGELSKHIKDLLSISLYAMNYFQQLRGCLPKIFFILRNQMDRSMRNQENSFDILENELIDLARAKNMEQKLKMSKEFFFLLPSAFNETMSNRAFGEEILKLREKIWNQIEGTSWKPRKIQDIYINACTLWELFDKYGQKLLSCETLKEYETKLNIEEKIKLLATKKAQELVISLNKDFTVKLKSDEISEETNFESIVRKSFRNCLEELEIAEFNEIRKEFEGYQKIVKNAIQDLKDFFKCEETSFIYSWDFKFKQKVKDFKLKDFEKTFTQMLNLKMKKLMDKSIIDSERTFEEYVDSRIKKFLDDLDKEFQLKDKNEEMMDLIKVFNEFKMLEIDEIKAKDVKNFKEKKFNKSVWKNINYKIKGSGDRTISYNINSLKDAKNNDMHILEKMIESFFLNITNDSLLVSLTEPKVQEFLDFLYKIKSDDQLSQLNFDFIQYELCYHYISQITKTISRNKKHNHEELKATYRAKAEKKRAEYLELYINRKNNLKTIENLCVNYLNRIIELQVDKLKMKTFEKIEAKLEKIPIDPEKFLHYAYRESFTLRNPEAIYHFVTDINGYVEKIFKKITKEILDDVMHQMYENYYETLHKEIKFFRESVSNFLKQQDVIFNSEDLFMNIKTIYPEIDLKYDQFFPREIKTDDFQKFIECVDFQVHFQNEESQKKSLENNAKAFLQGKKEIIMGCQFICPSCRSKCIKAAGNHENHKAYHVLNCFGGVNQLYSKEVVKLYCLEKQNVELKWVNCGEMFPNLIEMCKKVFPRWEEEFKMNQNAMNEKEKENQLVCWFYVHKPVLRKYGAKDSNLQTYLNEGQVLPENYVFNFFYYFIIVFCRTNWF